jgi:tRNA threonylcarbamoyladenosine biosynthesis protein TsaB
MMKVLGIETSSAVCSVGLADESGPSAEKSIVETRVHSEKILTLVEEVCRDGGVSLQELNGIAVSVGPGSFTGLRIGMSTAKGLCYSTGLPLIGIPTFDAVAAAAFAGNPGFSRLMICVDAKQGEFYRAVYEMRKEETVNTVCTGIADISGIADTLPGDAVLVTDRASLFEEKGTFSSKNISDFFRGDIVAALAVKKMQNGNYTVWENTIEPLYLKDFVVHSKVKKRDGF